MLALWTGSLVAAACLTSGVFEGAAASFGAGALIGLASATFGESTEVWEGDHFSLVNWLHPFGRHRGFWRDPAKRYGPLIRRLKDEGF